MTLKSALREILYAASAHSQEDICEQLEQQGYPVNQSKVSRLLRQIGAIKTKDEKGELVYCMPKEPVPLPTESALSNLILRVERNEVMVVIHTSPGAAQLIARMLDYNREKTNILGTVAGDDTIFITPVSVSRIDDTLHEVRDLLSDV